MIYVDVEQSIQQFTKQYGNLVDKQLPFAMAKATNDAALYAIKELRRTLDTYFTIRNSWVAKGIRRFTKATKKDPRSEVGTLDDYMRRQAEGGLKKPLHQQSVAIPIGARSPQSKITTRSKWPGVMLRRSTYHMGESPNGPTVVYQPKRSMKPQVMWLLRPFARVPAIWPFDVLVAEAATSKWPEAMVKALQYAIDTAK